MIRAVVADEPGAPAAPMAVPSSATADPTAIELDPLPKPLREQLAITSAEEFEADRLKGDEERLAIIDDLNAAYNRDDFERLDNIVQKYRDQPYTLVWGKSALKHVYEWLGRWEEGQAGEQHEEWLNKWLNARPKSATPRILLAERYIEWAWEARGSGFAGSVTEEGGKLFVERLERAKAYLSQAEKLEHPDAELYRLRISIIKGLGRDRDEADPALAAGIKLDRTYHPLYEGMAIYLLPRWHGQPGEVEQFADELVKRLEGDLGQEMYLRVAVAVLPYERSRFFANTAFDYRQIMDGWLAFSQKYKSHVYLQNEVAYLSALRRDRRTLLPLLNALNEEQLDTDVWGGTGSARSWRTWARGNQRVNEPEAMRLIPADRSPVRSLAFTADGEQLVTFGPRGVDPALIWSVTDVHALGRLPSLGAPFNGYAVSDDRELALAFDGDADASAIKFLRWSLARATPHIATAAPTARIGMATFSRGGDRIAALQADRAVTVWNTADLQEELMSFDVFHPTVDKKLVERFKNRPDALPCLAMVFSGDDKRLLAVVGDEELRVWEIENGRLIQRWCAEHDRAPKVRALAASRDGRLIAVGYALTKAAAIDLIDATTLKPVLQIEQKSPVISAIAFDDQGELVAAGGDFPDVHIWSTKTGRSLHSFRVSRPDVRCLAFSPDGALLAVGCADGAVRLYDISPYRAKTP